MTSTQTASVGHTAASVLAGVETASRRQAQASVDQFVGAALWADLHPGLDPMWIVRFHRDEDQPLNSDVVPLVDERCLAELGAALGRSTESARQLIGDALEVRHRLPRLWRSVLALRVPVFQAREVAQLVRGLSAETARFVDGQLHALPKLSSRRIERLVSAAIARHMPELAEQQRAAAAENRHVHIWAGTGTDGIAYLDAIIDADAALHLDAALTERAEQLGRSGCEESLQVRRSIALGDLARADQDTLAFHSDGVAQASQAGKGRQVVIYAHLSAEAVAGKPGTESEVGWLDARSGNVDLADRPILASQIRQWCSQPGTQVRVTPVIDLNSGIGCAGYQVSGRLREHLDLRDRHCIFPGCHALRTDADHRNPYDHDNPARGGPTHTDDVSLLCRRHHLLKTFTRGRYRMLRPGMYLWFSPMGRRYLRDQFGTYTLEEQDLE